MICSECHKDMPERDPNQNPHSVCERCAKLAGDPDTEFVLPAVPGAVARVKLGE